MAVTANSARFMIVERKTAKEFPNWEDYERYNPWGDDDYDDYNYLVDTKKGEIVFVDGGEPEDASLVRDYGYLVDLLNEVDAEND